MAAHTVPAGARHVVEGAGGQSGTTTEGESDLGHCRGGHCHREKNRPQYANPESSHKLSCCVACRVHPRVRRKLVPCGTAGNTLNALWCSVSPWFKRGRSAGVVKVAGTLHGRRPSRTFSGIGRRGGRCGLSERELHDGVHVSWIAHMTARHQMVKSTAAGRLDPTVGPGVASDPAGALGTARVAALCDGVFAIAMTILVLSIAVPMAETVPAERLPGRCASFSTHNLPLIRDPSSPHPGT